jgi:dienelactone hydrolase
MLLLRPLACLTAEPQAPAAATVRPQPATFSVVQTFNDAPFSYRIELQSETRQYRVYRLSYPSPVVTPLPQNNTVPADYYLPRDLNAASPKRPAVICLHILHGNFELEQITCSVLASHGVPAVMIKLPYYGERGLPGGTRALLDNPRLFLSALSQGIEDVRRTVDVLASRAEVDPARIGIVGTSLGGIAAAVAAETDPRLTRAALILAGGDLQTIIHHARETRDLSQFILRLPAPDRSEMDAALRKLDPLERAGRLRGRARQGRVLLINAGEDEVIPRACTQRLATALGIPDKVVWLDGLGHYTAIAALPRVLATVADFFAQDLPPGTVVTSPIAKPSDALTIVASLAQQAAAFLGGTEPQDGRGHFADLQVAIEAKGRKPQQGQLRLVRGSRYRFRLEAKIPAVGQCALGQGRYPWMVAAEGKRVFCGVLPRDARPENPLAFVDPRLLLKVQMLTGVLSEAVLTPQILEPLASVAEDPDRDGTPALRLAWKNHPSNAARLVLRKDRVTPESLTFQTSDVEVKVTFRVWQTNTVIVDGLFDEPTDLTVKQVDPQDLRRMFSALFAFALEKVQ